MGYETAFNLNIHGVTPEEMRKIYEEIAEAAYEAVDAVEYGFTGKWYDYGKDLAKTAARHPDAIIEVSGQGEAPDDIWEARYRGGQVETIRYEGLPPFREILTPEEEAAAFNNAYRAFIDAKDTMVRAAAAHIRRVKARITGREDCHLYLKPVTDEAPLCTVEGLTPITDAPYRTVVTGISDDGESVTTEDDPMDLQEMTPESVHNVVLMVETLETDLKDGRYIGRYDEDDGWFIVEPVE